MRVDERAYHLAPDFSARFQAAIDHAGMTPRQVAESLAERGLGTSLSHVHRLLKGGEHRANPTHLLIAGLADATGVPVTWFFDTRPGVTLEDLIGQAD